MTTKNLKDGVLKSLILLAISNKKVSSRTIYNTIKNEYSNYNSFMSAMHRMWRYGYLHREGRGKCERWPYVYSLTQKGIEHEHNPFLNLQHRNAFAQKLAMEILQDTEKFQNAVQEGVRIELARTAGTGGAGGGGIAPPYDDVFGNVDGTVDDVKHEHGIITHTEVKLTENQIKAKARYERRLPILGEYGGDYLDEEFFKRWKGIWPHLMKGKTFDAGMPGSVEFFSLSNVEVTQRKHTKGRLTAEQIYKSMFKIIKIHKKKDGKIVNVEVIGRGMRKPYLMKL